MSIGKSGLREEGRAYFLDCVFNGFQHQQECWDNGLSVKPLFRREAYVEGRLKVFLFLERLGAPAFSPILADTLNNKRLPRRHVKAENTGANEVFDSEEAKIVSDYLSDLRSSYNEVVFVAGVQSLDSVKILVPAHIRLERLYRPNDLFSGARCLSITDGALKSVLTIGEGEEYSLGVWGLIAHHAPSENIESAFQIVDCIAQDKREFVGDGLMLLDEDFTLVGALFNPTPQFEWLSGKESIASNLKIVDMLLGPFNLQTAWLD